MQEQKERDRMISRLELITFLRCFKKYGGGIVHSKTWQFLDVQLDKRYEKQFEIKAHNFLLEQICKHLHNFNLSIFKLLLQNCSVIIIQDYWWSRLSFRVYSVYSLICQIDCQVPQDPRHQERWNKKWFNENCDKVKKERITFIKYVIVVIAIKEIRSTCSDCIWSSIN